MIEVLLRSGQVPFRMIGASRVIFKEDRYLDSLPVKTGKLTGPQIVDCFLEWPDAQPRALQCGAIEHESP